MKMLNRKQKKSKFIRIFYFSFEQFFNYSKAYDIKINQFKIVCATCHLREEEINFLYESSLFSHLNQEK